MWIHGLRRFGGDSPHRLRLDNKLVCIIGANEVGKSTLLDALRLSRHETREPDSEDALPINPLLLTRGESITEERELVRVRYRLDTDDHAALASQQSAKQLKDIQWLERRLTADGRIATSYDPAPVRDKTLRHDLAKKLTTSTNSDSWPRADDLIDGPADPNVLTAVMEKLNGTTYYLGQDTTGALSTLADWLDEDVDELSDWYTESTSHTSLAEAIRATLIVEAIPHPTSQAQAALTPRIPEFIQFDKVERGIGDEYDLSDPDLPEALLNLADLAGLDLDLLREKVIAEETGTVEDLRENANAILAEKFEAWSQNPTVKVSFGLSGTRLFVHVKSGSGPSMRLGERSEGLRQFVALVALTAQHKHVVAPVLLIDEVEMHLHYDAQADLIGVLAEQTTAAQVIYTTHSAACLPEDLGSAVRVVEGVGDLTASKVRQQFWSEDVGLGSLLMAMGAASLALVLLRPAALVEGGADLVLLPSLIREATGNDILGFQIVPGGAEVARERVIGLDLHGTATIWIYDGDEGGVAARKFITDQGVDDSRVFLLSANRRALDLEDFVHPATYVKAVNLYGEDVAAGERFFAIDDLPTETCARHDAVTEWFEANELRGPSKVAIANKILELRGSVPLVDPKRKPTLKKLYSDAIKIFAADERRRGAG